MDQDGTRLLSTQSHLSIPVDTPKQLCNICAGITFFHFPIEWPFVESEYQLGTFAEVYERPDCPLCCLIADVHSKHLGVYGRSAQCQLRSKSWEWTSSYLPNSLGPSSHVALGYIEVVSAPHKSTPLIIGRFDRVFYPQAALQVEWYQSAVQLQTGAVDRNPLFARRPLQSVIDTGLIQSWLRRCQNIHEHTGSSWPFALFKVPHARFRLIDTEMGQLRVPDRICPYATLSYVWGSSAKAKAEIGSYASKAGYNGNKDVTAAIVLEDLPQTIKDAIFLVKLLGLRFLWVDAICINQEDEKEKEAVVKHMDEIYASSKLTIVAASGTDAHSGLPGLRPGTRWRDRVTTVHTAQGSIYLTPARPELPGLLHDAVWHSRGWTYQEHVLSPRCLYFTEKEMLYSCSEAEWREDYVCECRLYDYPPARDMPRILQYNYTGALRPSPPYTGDQTTSYHFNARALTFVDYRIAVNEYSQRRLSFSDDILAAFYGVLRLFDGDDNFTNSLHHGLPIKYFEKALQWSQSRATGDSYCKRRLDKNGQPSSLFPTWSWAGWDGSSGGIYYWDTSTSLFTRRADGSVFEIHYRQHRERDVAGLLKRYSLRTKVLKWYERLAFPVEGFEAKVNRVTPIATSSSLYLRTLCGSPPSSILNKPYASMTEAERDVNSNVPGIDSYASEGLKVMLILISARRGLSFFLLAKEVQKEQDVYFERMRDVELNINMPGIENVFSWSIRDITLR